MKGELVALMAGHRIGTVRQDGRGRLAFVYDDAWRLLQGAYPLSLSMPLAIAEHEHAPINAFLSGLLPDSDRVLERWAKRFQVSPRNAFALIAHVGEDCAGAVQFASADRVEALLESALDSIEWLTETDIAERLRLLRHDRSAWRSPKDTGQFSLAGAQPKTALLNDNGRWGVPSGRVPTTHILKPPTGEFDGYAENEHFCMSLARAMGLAAARSAVHRFDDEIAIVVERYDRIRTDAGVVRIHQEDLCQALAIPPTSKYENEGGPGVKTIVDLLRTNSTRPADDETRFIDAVIFNWLIAGTDAHAKNYALLIGAGGRTRLAPLYDISSALPYADGLHRLKLAMKVGGDYRIRDIGAHQWRKLEEDLRIDADEIVDRANALAIMMPDHAADMRRRAVADGLVHPIVDRLTTAITARARHCMRSLLTSEPRGDRMESGGGR